MIKIDLSDGQSIENPSETQVIEAIENLKRDDFIILSDSSRADDLIQALAERKSFIVEYHDTQTDHLYRSRKLLKREEAVKLFMAYLRGDQSYKTSTRWRDITYIMTRPMSSRAMKIHAAGSVLVFFGLLVASSILLPRKSTIDKAMISVLSEQLTSLKDSDAIDSQELGSVIFGLEWALDSLPKAQKRYERARYLFYAAFIGLAINMVIGFRSLIWLSARQRETNTPENTSNIPKKNCPGSS